MVGRTTGTPPILMAGLTLCSGSDLLSEVTKMDEKYEYMITHRKHRGDELSLEEMNTLGSHGWENYAVYLDEDDDPVLLWKRAFKFRKQD